MSDAPAGFVELPRLSSTRYGPLDGPWDGINLFRDSPAGMYPINRAEYETHVTESLDGRTVVVFVAPQLSFACRCLAEMSIAHLVPEVASAAEVEAFFAEGGDLTQRWEAAHPGTLPHVAACFHRVFCREMVPGA